MLAPHRLNLPHQPVPNPTGILGYLPLYCHLQELLTAYSLYQGEALVQLEDHLRDTDQETIAVDLVPSSFYIL
jgi:hypothetical protein